MITIDCLQGSTEWMSARVGIPTASKFDEILDVKGKPSRQRQKYLYALSGERIIGSKEDSYQNATMKRGIEMEHEARELYEMINGVEVKQVGICYPDEKKLYAASPDGLVGDNGLVEIKCPLLTTIVAYHINGNLVEDYFQQLQGQLLVTGREWVDIIAYYPAFKPLIIRVNRDENFTRALIAELHVFCVELDEITEKLRRIK
jgi:hypothetical protein